MEYADSLGFDPVVVECDEAVADYDGDGMAAIIEARLGTDPLLADSDGDGIDDYWEVIAGLDPLVGDSLEDPDGDGRTNLEEYLNSGYFYTNPLNPDTDGDGLCDGVTSVMSGETVLCGPGEGDSATPELDAARLRLLAESAIGELTLGDGDTWSDELEEGDTLKLSVAGALDAGTYTVRFDNGSGSVYAIEAYVSEGATYIFVDTGDLGDDASGNFDIDVVDDSGSSLLDSGAASVNISQRLYLHYGLHSPVVATNSDGETVWRRAYLPFGSDFAGSPSHPLTITNSSITHGFVGRRSDNDVGLYQLGARWYDPDLGRFVSVDPVAGGINQYAYAYNNPFVYQDASGMEGEVAEAALGYSECLGAYSHALFLVPADAVNEASGGRLRSTENAHLAYYTYYMPEEGDPTRACYQLGYGVGVSSALVGAAELLIELYAAGESSQDIAPPSEPVDPNYESPSPEPSPGVDEKTDESDGPTEAYNRRKHYGNTPKQSDRRELGAEPDEVVDHDPPLVQRYYEGDLSNDEKPGYQMNESERKESANDRGRMQTQKRKDSNIQGGKMSNYSKKKKEEHGL